MQLNLAALGLQNPATGGQPTCKAASEHGGSPSRKLLQQAVDRMWGAGSSSPHRRAKQIVAHALLRTQGNGMQMGEIGQRLGKRGISAVSLGVRHLSSVFQDDPHFSSQFKAGGQWLQLKTDVLLQKEQEQQRQTQATQQCAPSTHLLLPLPPLPPTQQTSPMPAQLPPPRPLPPPPPLHQHQRPQQQHWQQQPPADQPQQQQRCWSILTAGADPQQQQQQGWSILIAGAEYEMLFENAADADTMGGTGKGVVQLFRPYAEQLSSSTDPPSPPDQLLDKDASSLVDLLPRR